MTKNLLNSQKGFTLIELLIVVLIIGILAAIAIPVFNGQRTKAKNSVAQSTLRNAQTAASSYYTKQESYAGVTPDTLKAEESTLEEEALAPAPGNSANPKAVYLYSAASGNRIFGTASDDSETVKSAGIVLCTISKGDKTFCSRQKMENNKLGPWVNSPPIDGQSPDTWVPTTPSNPNSFPEIGAVVNPPAGGGGTTPVNNQSPEQKCTSLSGTWVPMSYPGAPADAGYCNNAQCPSGTTYDFATIACKAIPNCTLPETYDSFAQTCHVPCPANSSWNPMTSACVTFTPPPTCGNGEYYNGMMCVPSGGGMGGGNNYEVTAAQITLWRQCYTIMDNETCADSTNIDHAGHLEDGTSYDEYPENADVFGPYMGMTHIDTYADANGSDYCKSESPYFRSLSNSVVSVVGSSGLSQVGLHTRNDCVTAGAEVGNPYINTPDNGKDAMYRINVQYVCDSSDANRSLTVQVGDREFTYTGNQVPCGKNANSSL